MNRKEALECVLRLAAMGLDNLSPAATLDDMHDMGEAIVIVEEMMNAEETSDATV